MKKTTVFVDPKRVSFASWSNKHPYAGDAVLDLGNDTKAYFPCSEPAQWKEFAALLQAGEPFSYTFTHEDGQ